MPRTIGIIAMALSLLLLPSVASPSQAKPKIEKQSFTSNGKKRTFYLVVPEVLKADEKLPLLLVFHGSGHNGLSIVEPWKDIAVRENLIVAGLDSLDSSVWSTTKDNPGVLRDLVEMLESKYPINPRRVYLFGHSGGAVFAIDLAMIESEYFAAAAVHAGSWREKDEFDMMRNARRKTPLAIWVGTQDPYFSIASVHSTRDALAAKGFHVEITEMPGHDHWYYDLAPKINEAAWQFLKQYELSAEPRFAEFVGTAEATDANKLIADLRSLQDGMLGLVDQSNLLRARINGKDLTRDAAELKNLATHQADLLEQASAMSHTAADKAELVAGLKIGQKNQEYMLATAKYYLKFAELLDAKRAEAELLLTTEAPEVITSKQAEVRKRIEALQQEANALHADADKKSP